MTGPERAGWVVVGAAVIGGAGVGILAMISMGAAGKQIALIAAGWVTTLAMIFLIPTGTNRWRYRKALKEHRR